MTTAKPGELVVCDSESFSHNPFCEPHPQTEDCINPCPAGATAAPQAEAGPHSLQPHESCAVESCEIAEALMALLDERNDLATQRDELADALEALLTAYCGTAEMQQAEIDQAAAALKKAGRR